ncbi:ABC transporter substrate-binding protein [Candidatus Poribacteria bacterium]|nr:ABC transporter substrate-binding protein [Candidatus Poribacteria bacterium]
MRALVDALGVVLILLALSPRALADDLPTTPTRIISCAPNLTEMLFALGAGDAVIGVTRYCEFPPEAQSRPKFGDLFNPSLEAMVGADPDLIVLYPSSTKVVEYFAQRPGVRLLQTPKCDSLADIEQTLRLLGDATGRAREAEELIAETRAGLAQLRNESSGRPKRSVLLVLGRERGSLAHLTAVGGGTYITELLEAAGGTNVLDASLGMYPQLSREALLGLAPDVLIELHHEADSPAERGEARAAWAPFGKLIPAVREGRVLLLTDKHLLVPGAHLERDARALRGALESPP